MEVCSVLVGNLIKKKFKRTNDKSISGVNAVYKVEGVFDTLYFWNSSNNQKIFDSDDLLDEIHSLIHGGNLQGSVSDNMNEFMFEVEEV